MSNSRAKKELTSESGNPAEPTSARLWQASSFCGEGANCVSVAGEPGRGFRLRESAEPGVVLIASPTALRGLLTAVKGDSGLRAPSWG